MEPAQVIRRTVKQAIMIKCHYYLDKASVAQGQSACPGAGGGTRVGYWLSKYWRK